MLDIARWVERMANEGYQGALVFATPETQGNGSDCAHPPELALAAEGRRLVLGGMVGKGKVLYEKVDGLQIFVRLPLFRNWRESLAA
jgi:hypothetical protein